MGQKRKWKWLSVVLLSFMLLSLVAPGRVLAAAKLKLSKAKATMEVDSTLTLKLGDIAAKEVKWSSSARKVATVSAKGTITAKAEGTATIKAKYDGKTYSCKVTVVDSNKVENKIETYLKEEFGAAKYKEEEDGLVTELYAKGKTLFFSITYDESFDFGVELTKKQRKEAMQKSAEITFEILTDTLQEMTEDLQERAYKDAKLIFQIYDSDKTLILEKEFK